MSFWTDEKLHKLTQIYSNFANLWDRRHLCYDNLRSRYTSYSKILVSLSTPAHVSVSDVICKLKELRNTYVCELQKIEVASRAGCIYRPNQTWFGIMNEFLYDHLDADEKLAEFSSSEDGTVCSEEIPDVCSPNDRCSDFNSGSDSDSANSLDPRTGNSLRKLRRCFKSPKKSQAYFVRSPTVLRSTKMNTKYEFPRKSRASSMPVKSYSPLKESCSILRHVEDAEQCTQLEVKMTSSDVSIKYLKTESVNGDEKCYKKNLKGPRCSTDGPPCFKNIKMVISKSGYTASELRKNSDESEDKDTEFWEMMSMLNLGVPCPLTKLETVYSPDTSCASISSVDSLVCGNNGVLLPNYNATCCPPSCRSTSDAKKSKRKTSSDRFPGRKGCCSKVKELRECKEVRNREETLRDSPCTKKTKVVCLGDGTLFDDNLLELVQDLSIKICPVDAHCAGGSCSSGNEQPGNVFANFLSCRTCTSATRPVKEYEMDAEGSIVRSDVGPASPSPGTPSTTEENVVGDKTSSETVDAATRNERSVDFREGSESTTKLKNDARDSEAEMNAGENPEDGNPAPSDTAERRKLDVKFLLESADSRPSSDRDSGIFDEAKKELWEAGKLYNGGKYVTHENVGPASKESLEFDDFGAEVASTLNTMGKQRAMKLKRMIAAALQGETRKKF